MRHPSLSLGDLLVFAMGLDAIPPHGIDPFSRNNITDNTDSVTVYSMIIIIIVGFKGEQMLVVLGKLSTMLDLSERIAARGETDGSDNSQSTL